MPYFPRLHCPACASHHLRRNFTLDNGWPSFQCLETGCHRKFALQEDQLLAAIA